MGTGPSGKNASPAENLEIPAFRNRNAGRARLPFPGVREIYTIRQPFQCREIADNHVLSVIVRCSTRGMAGHTGKTGQQKRERREEHERCECTALC